MSLKRLRIGELLALAGAICVIVSLSERNYETPAGNLDAWHTFGPGVVLLLLAVCAALALVLSALIERTPALPVSTAVWCVPLGLIAAIAALVRALERPDHATEVCYGAWLALAGAVLILAGAWQTLRDERPSQYPPAHPESRAAPPAADG
jgi:drug/metabolite transporter (DMT)-like permease